MVSKRELFLEFGYNGWINDIYISRKQGRVMKSPFAFIRFNAYASAMRAIKRLNGSLWKKTISVSLAKFKRSEKPETDGGNGTRQRKTKWVWRVISKENKKDGTDEQRSLYQEQGKGVIARKVVETVADEYKRDILDRSLMGVMMKTMNLQSVAKLWGNLVLADYTTEHCLSFTVARLLIDSYEWSNISEWVRLKVDGREIEIHVREFGGEIYSIQTHPSSSDGVIDSETLASKSVSRVEESPPVESTVSMGGIGNDLNILNVGACPRADTPLNVVVENVGGFFDERMMSGGAHYGTLHAEKDNIGVDKLNACVQMVMQPATMGHIESPSNDSLGKNPRPITVKEDLLGGDKARRISSSSCPFPPGFGPCSSLDHVHHLIHEPTSDPHETNVRVDVVVSASEYFHQDGHVVTLTPQIENPDTTTGGGDLEDEWLKEAIKTREVCEYSGISFKTDNKEALIARLKRKKEGRPKVEAPKKRKPIPARLPPGIKGRSLSTRILRSGSKPKSL
ncbi:hypothetical protein PIB30_021124 [Stylosanthes scabra]|uniref:RRM domain-containing protein n=1 Tax=Stylosanthes scabra TaxID=79078 RepID=A0ABU6Q9E5_9FABA|nr:hypothetical protein [Stylosanthes scabra]